MNPNDNALTTSERFELERLRREAQKMTKSELENALVGAYETLLVQEKEHKQAIKLMAKGEYKND